MIFKTSGNLPVLLLLTLQALFVTQGCSSCQEEETSQPTPRPRDMGSARADMTMIEDDADRGAADLTNLPRPTDILLSSPQATLEVGTSQSLSYRVIDQEGEDLTQSAQLLWSNLDAGVAELRLDADSPGTFSIRGTRRGTTTLTASTLSGEVMATLDVEVSEIIADERTNQLIILSDERSFGRIQQMIELLDVPTAVGGQIHVKFLEYANADDLASTLSSLASGSSNNRNTRMRNNADLYFIGKVALYLCSKNVRDISSELTYFRTSKRYQVLALD